MYGITYTNNLFASHFQSYIYQTLSRFYGYTDSSFLLIYDLSNNFFCIFPHSIAECNLYASFHSSICTYILKCLCYCNKCDLNVENEIALRIYKKLNLVNIQTKVYRLYLHSNYNFFPNIFLTQNDKEGIQKFIISVRKEETN
ncbi:conserved Plasmodium protein, unknown function [Plasmodium chabaudi chabaudi]|uniref:Uncharacterized protein n=1 Tax=Plasmodium chabaudi chabaudi TaxID=31271 RepID=A0A077TLQ5_PLACU|nr:conserved Plasmodium protein, unknown function [Plasmodium chabaudi chabaudi]SCM23843.1 conserved Plasmodium protein, unknown function [Plasmodium chabaudi chabaudi]SCN61301.1 conserved Plasmodium protein, unknown function [Plasmodium chabaudi chabaudi]VTZ69270.1 conserved Plasmodium protein, unknown function [Plasmodium chabaudi chabaudi]|eukprot:XP_745139.2 conserved Plasmodium protein, unknown function [Plasmodium chabaudi chabaudi]